MTGGASTAVVMPVVEGSGLIAILRGRFPDPIADAIEGLLVGRVRAVVGVGTVSSVAALDTLEARAGAFVSGMRPSESAS